MRVWTHAAWTANLLRTIRRKGLGRSARAILDRVEERILEPFYERTLGIATRGVVSRDALGYGPECSFYGPSTYGNVRRILRALEIDAGHDVFVDFGAGQGRVLVMAARRPFARVVGVEYSSTLSETARRNVDRARPRLRCPQVEIVACDAARWEVPDDATVLYFASPFGGSVLEAVLENITASLTRRPRPISIVSHGYDAANPFEARLRACDWLTLRAEIALQRSNSAWIYVNSRWNSRPAAPAIQTSA